MLNVKVCKKLGFFVTRYTRYINTGFIVIWKKELHCMIPKLDGFKGQLYELVLPWRTFGPSYDSYLFTILELKLNALYIIQRHEKALEVSPQEMQKLEISNFKMTTKNTFLRSSTSLTIIWSLEIGILRGITLLKFRLHTVVPFKWKIICTVIQIQFWKYSVYVKPSLNNTHIMIKEWNSFLLQRICMQFYGNGWFSFILWA